MDDWVSSAHVDWNGRIAGYFVQGLVPLLGEEGLQTVQGPVDCHGPLIAAVIQGNFFLENGVADSGLLLLAWLVWSEKRALLSDCARVRPVIPAPMMSTWTSDFVAMSKISLNWRV